MSKISTPKILILAYSLDDDFSHISKKIGPLCAELFRQKFTLGVEKLPLSFELNAQILETENRIHQIEMLSNNTFHVSKEGLLQGEIEQSKAKPNKALKPIINRAKILSFQDTILKILQENDSVLFFGLGDKPNAHTIFECLSTNNIELTTLFVEKNNLIALKNTLKSFKVAIETYLLVSSHYSLSQESEEHMTHSHVSFLNLEKHFLPSTIATFVKKICQSLDEQTRLLVSMQHIGKNSKQHSFYAPLSSHKPYHIPNPQPSVPASSQASLSHKMKSTLREFRGIFNEDEGGGTTTTTIVGNRDRDSSED